VDQVLQRLRQRKIVQWALAYVAAAFALIQMLDLIGQRFGWPEPIGRVLIVAAAIGFAVTLVLAWYHGERGAQHVTGAELLIVALLLVIGGGLLWSVARAPHENAEVVASATTAPAKPVAIPDGKSIAVLPFANTSGDPSNEYFSDGLSEELISVLARIPDLKIIGRNSSFHFKGSHDDSRSIGEQLGVAHLLEGSVRKQGEHVRIAVDLIAAVDGRQLWAETYDRELKDIFAVQSEIAAAVVQQLKVKLLGPRVAEGGSAEANPNIAAYNAFLQGQHLLGNFNEADLRKAAAYFEEATRLDPQYALAYAQLSRAWRSLSGSFLTDKKEIDDSSSRARAAAMTALKLSPELSEGHAALGLLLLTTDLDPVGAELELRKAVALAPNDTLNVHGLAYLLTAQGKLAEGEAMTHLAMALDPKWLGPYQNLARIQMGSNRLDEAEATLREMIRIQPEASHSHAYLTLVDLRRNDAAAALRDAALEPAGFWHDFAVAAALQAQPERAAADRALQTLIETHRYGGPFQIAIVYAVRKEPDKVFEWLDHAYEARDSGLTQLLVTPFVLDYREDPRFAALATKLNINPALLDHRQ
jgi:TolB-like protein/Tfp pilus assembly protein PilF